MLVTYGKIYMKSGSVLPFAATKLEWEGGWEGLTKLSYNFVPLKELDIPLLSYVEAPQIEAFVVEGTTEVEEEQ